MNKRADISLLYAVILAAGKGKRINAAEKNKVVFEVAGTPMIKRTLSNLKNAGINNVVVVVGHAKNSVISVLDVHVKVVEQKKLLGTADAVRKALVKIPQETSDILVLNGDDSFLFNKKILRKLYALHKNDKADLTLLTLEIDNPKGLGRIIRGKKGDVVRIAEEKDSTDLEKQIHEINPGCYIFDRNFLREFIGEIPKSQVTGEYYITSILEAATKNHKKLSALTLKNFKWRGVNTISELEEASKLVEN